MKTPLNKTQQYMLDTGWKYHYEFPQIYPATFPFDDAKKWCEEQHYVAGIDYSYAGPYWWFKKQEHYNWFVLRWS